MIRIALAGVMAACAAACADQNVGQAIPADQLYYPVGIDAFEDGGRNRLVVLSTNFDQRYQSGQLSLFNADALIEGLIDRLGGGTPGQDLCTSPEVPFFAETFEIGDVPVFLNRVRVPGIGGEILRTDFERTRDDDGELIVPPLDDEGNPVVPTGTVTATRFFFTDRLSSSLIQVRLDAGRLVCALDGEPLLRNTDCSAAFVVPTEAEDPFDLTLARMNQTDDPRFPDGQEHIVVSHLFPYADDISIFGLVTFHDLESLFERARGGLEPDSGPFLNKVTGFRFGAVMRDAFGVSGLTFSNARPDRPTVVALPLADSGEFEAVAIEIFGDGSEDDPFEPAAIDRLLLDEVGNTSSSRGIVTLQDPSRLLASVRFAIPSEIRSSGVALLRLDEDGLRARSFVDLGQELGKPSIRPPDEAFSGELAYLGDIRQDRLYIVDVTRDEPVVVGEINGRAQRTIQSGSNAGRVLDARTFDGPVRVAFVEAQGGTFAFVTNFANSTLAVLDVSSPAPRNHCILARLGRDVDANGEDEEDRL